MPSRKKAPPSFGGVIRNNKGEVVPADEFDEDEGQLDPFHIAPPKPPKVAKVKLEPKPEGWGSW